MTHQMAHTSELACTLTSIPPTKCSGGLCGHLAPYQLRSRRLTRKLSMGAIPDSMLPFTTFEEEMLAQERQMLEFQRQMNDRIEKEFPADGYTSKTEAKSGSGYRIETREEKTESGYMYSYSKSVTVVGSCVRDMPVQGFGIQPAVMALIAAYSVVCYLFNKGFGATTFKPTKRLPLSFAWPFLIVFNENFRVQLVSAVKAGWKGNSQVPDAPTDDPDV